jgi:hypothetical protein
VLGLILLSVCILYASSLLIGWYLAKRGRLDAARLARSQRSLTDPLTYRQGIHQGAAFRHPLTRPRGIFLAVMILEFAAYLVATALGVNLVVTPLFGGAFPDALRLLALLYLLVVGALLAGAWLEVYAIRSRMPAGFELPHDLDREKLRARALDMIVRQSKGQ